jgi:hypothetical protein
VITAPLNQRRRPAFAQVELDMAVLFASLDVADTEQVMAEWVEAFDAENPGPDPGEPDDTLYHSRSLGDRGELRGSFSPASAALIDAALAVAETKDADGELRVPSERRADALVDIVRHFLDTHDRPRRRRHTPHVNIVVTPDQLEHGRSGSTLGGRVIPGWGIATMACDSAIRRMVLADGEILELGRLVRTATPAQFDAVATRDRHCRYPGCDRPASWCDAHHAFPWENGGLTDVDNLVLLCRRHHTRIHQRGVHAKLLPDATLEITLPGGRVLTSTPPKPGPLL